MNCFVTEGWGGAAAGGAVEEIHIFAWHLDPVHRIQSKFGMDILLDPRNKPAKEFFFFSKSKMAAGGQKFSTRYTFSIFS